MSDDPSGRESGVICDRPSDQAAAVEIDYARGMRFKDVQIDTPGIGMAVNYSDVSGENVHIGGAKIGIDARNSVVNMRNLKVK